MRSIVLALLLFSSAAQAQYLTPILMSNGEDVVRCDGTFKYLYRMHLRNVVVVKSYLFGNLITHQDYGADVVIRSTDSYPLINPEHGFGTIGDLHLFDFVRPGGARQGQYMMDLTPGVLINGTIEVAAICWGGGTLELYAMLWVKQANGR
jgi:hypothetical protein